MDYPAFFKKNLEMLREEGRYRVFIPLERIAGEAPYCLWHKEDATTQKVNVFCSNDYLGMSHHTEVVKTLQEAAAIYGAGSGGTRNISGTAHIHAQLEQKMAEQHGKEAALIFSSGYTANKSSLGALGRNIPNCMILSDEKNHASMIQGIRQSGSDKIVFKHNDMQDLEEKLKTLPLDRPKIIAFVSVYSMEGDIAPIAEVIALAKKYNALTFLDEVHAVGIYGPKGNGLAAALGLDRDIDIIQANFAKGYGVVGGYIAANHDIIDFVRLHATGFIFTTSMPPATAAACLKSVEILEKDRSLALALLDNVKYLKYLLSKTSIPVLENDSHIIPVVIGDPMLCKFVCDNLIQEYGYYLQPINYPTVPRGKECMRVTVTPFHTREMLEGFVAALNSVWLECQGGSLADPCIGIENTFQQDTNPLPIYSAHSQHLGYLKASQA